MQYVERIMGMFLMMDQAKQVKGSAIMDFVYYLNPLNYYRSQSVRFIDISIKSKKNKRNFKFLPGK